MDVREKLVELLAEKCMETCKERGLNVCSAEYCNQHKEKCTGFYADHLIAHGVTVQEWISVKDRLPKPFENVIVFRGGKISIDYHEENGWFAYDFNGKRATHWMPLPQPPKGE